MKFNRYSSIDNSYRIKEVNQIMEQYGNDEFVVQEKIHGSNFSIYYDGDRVRYGKRSSLLSEEDNFMTYKMLPLGSFVDSIKQVFAFLSSQYDDVSQVSIHGEIFGGVYNHPDVEKVKNVTRVQKEVQYSPNIEFMAFDIMVNDEFVDMDQFQFLCKTYKIPYIPFLFKGSFKDCLEYNNTFQTTIPKLLGYPEIEDNEGEGVVIKSLKTRRLRSGSRVVLKSKTQAFSEKGKSKPIKERKELPEHLLKMMSLAGSYVTENRMRNVLSHVGEIKQNEFGKLLGLINKDTLNDFMKENPEFLEMGKEERKEVTRYVNGEIGDLIRPNFRNIVDGVF